MGRLPTQADFPAGVTLSIVPPPPQDAPNNVLLLLHGLGDTHASFARLGAQMQLPETVGVALQGGHNVLDLEGFHWGDDILFDSSTGGLDADAGFTRTTDVLTKVVKESLMEKCGYAPREILLFGFGQGGMAALHLADLELGGVISIGAPLSSSAPASLSPLSRTPVLVCAGSSASSVTPSAEDKLRRCFASVEVKRYRRPGDTMPASRDEMLPVMQFLARRLRSTKGVPKGAVPIA